MTYGSLALGAILGASLWALSYWYLKRCETEFMRKVESDINLDLVAITFAPLFAILLGLKRWYRWTTS